VPLSQINGGKVEQSGITITSTQTREEPLAAKFFF
jgi:hypothetical protein